jgi:Xaa-Pro dipeptidase
MGATMEISPEEYSSRLSLIRQAMDYAGLEGLLVYSWRRNQIRYVSGYTPNYVANVGMAVVPLQGDPTLFIRFPFDLERAQAMCWFADVRDSGDMPTMVRDVVSRLSELHLDHSSVGIVGGDNTMDELPYTLFKQLQGALPAARFRDVRQLLMEIRLTKSPSEYSLLRRSASVADAAIAASEKVLTHGASERSVVAAAEAEARSLGAEDCLMAIASRSAEEQIGPPEDKNLESGHLTILEAAVQVDGYWTQVARTFSIGEFTDQQAGVYRATHDAYQAAVEAAAVDAPMSRIYEAACAVLEAAGYAGYIKHDMGHGIGLDLPEPPKIDAEAQAPLQAGMALVLHPALRVPQVGGAFVGGTVLITEDGPVPIHHIPEGLT